MTEEEARQKWCPFVRVSTPLMDWTRTHGGRHLQIGAETANRGVTEEKTRCIGSDCMAWRVGGRLSQQTGQFQGYCGLAGAPL